MKIIAGLVVAGVLLFGASLNDPFHFDDELIRIDSNVTTAARWGHFFNPLYLRQFTFFTFYLNHLAGGLNPAGYHVVNVLIHIANAVLLFLLLRGFIEPWAATVAAAVFLVHSIQTEAVLYVYQRSILLACFFSLLALIALVNRRIGLAVLAFVLAFESKESALAVPLVLVLFLVPQRWREIRDWQASKGAVDRSPTGRRLVVLLVAVLALAAFALGLLAEEKTVGLNTGVNPLQYLLTQTRVVYTYLRLLVFPIPQSLEYDFANAGGILTTAGILLILIAGWWWKSLSMIAFFILLAPTSSIIPSADAAFEHRLYLPMLAVSLLVAHLMSKIPHRRTWVAGGVLAVLAILTVRREMVWSSDIALWEDTAQHTPGKPRVWFNLGGAYLRNNPDKARAALLRALELQPHWPEALYDLGLIEQDKKNWEKALAYYQRALSQDPKYWPACNNIGNT